MGKRGPKLGTVRKGSDVYFIAGLSVGDSITLDETNAHYMQNLSVHFLRSPALKDRTFELGGVTGVMRRDGSAIRMVRVTRLS